MHLKYCFQQKFIFENFIFENFIFRKFCLIASLKFNEASLRHKHSLEILFTHWKKKIRTLRQCIHSKCNRNISYIKSPPRKFSKFLYSFPCPAPGQVATSLPGRDLLDDQARSLRQSHVATSLLPNPNNPGPDLKKWGRDTNFHTAGRTMSRHQIGVATPLRPIQVATSKRGRDMKPPVANPPRSRRPFMVATSR